MSRSRVKRGSADEGDRHVGGWHLAKTGRLLEGDVAHRVEGVARTLGVIQRAMQLIDVEGRDEAAVVPTILDEPGIVIHIEVPRAPFRVEFARRAADEVDIDTASAIKHI